MRTFLARVKLGSASSVQTPRANLSSYLLSEAREGQYAGGLVPALRDRRLENFYCLRCNREIEPGDKSVAVYLFAQTVGIRPRQKSSSQRICFCPQCSVSLAMGPAPEGALNLAAWKIIRDLVGSDPALNRAAWDALRGIAGLLSPGENENLPRVVNGRSYFEF